MRTLARLVVRGFAVIGVVVTGWTTYSVLARYTDLFDGWDLWDD